MPEFLNYNVRALKQNLAFVIFCVLCFVVGFVLGVIFEVKSDATTFSDGVCGFYDMLFLRGGSVIKYGISKLAGGACVLLLVALCGFTFWTMPLQVGCLIYFSFVAGSSLIAFFGGLSFVGAAFYLLVIFPSQILRSFSIIVLATSLIFYNEERNGRCAKIETEKIASLYLTAFCVFAVAVLYECLMIAFVIKPLNIFF